MFGHSIVTIATIAASATIMMVSAGCGEQKSTDTKAAAAKKAPAHKPAADKDKHGEKHAAADKPAHASTAKHGGAAPTLKGLMTQLSVDMAEISNAVWQENFAQIAKHAKAIADHPHVSVSERKRLTKTLGPDFGAFVKHDRLVHDAAKRLEHIASKSQMKESLDELSTLQRGCVSCHTAFRKRLTTK